MGFIHSFVKLDEGQLIRRRHLLDYYANVAQLSSLVALLAISLVRWSHLTSNNYLHLLGRREKERQSPRASRFPRSSATSSASIWKRFDWYLDDRIVDSSIGWGARREWLVACVWTFWLLGLVFVETGNGRLISFKSEACCR